MEEGLAEMFRALFKKHEGVFASNIKDLGSCHVGMHAIDTGEAKPIKQRPYRYSAAENEFLSQHIDEPAQGGLIERCGADWASPVVVVDKKEPGARRMCVDQRAVNGVTKGDAYPMPTVDSMLEGLEGTMVMSMLDMHSGFYQIRMNPRDKDKTAFITNQGLFRFTRMPFGLKNASATFQRVMNEILEGLDFAKVYVDDILVSSPDYETHLRHLTSTSCSLGWQMPTCESRPRSVASPDLRFRTWDTC
jgi:hypothetical protein